MKTAALFAAGAVWAAAAAAQTAAPGALAPFAASASATRPEPPWRFEGFPAGRRKTPTQFSLTTESDGRPALLVATDDSYGTLVQRVGGAAPRALAWRWRLDQPLARSDIRTKDGDDSALKVCVMFDEPLARIALLERSTLRLARAAYPDAFLPSATVCYLWDGNTYPAGSSGANPFSARVRYIVLRGPQDATGRWFDEQRDVRADFQQLFGAESPETPPLLAVGVGADSDNTHGRSAARVAALRFVP